MATRTVTTTTSEAKRKLDADLLTASEIERLLRACSNRAPTGIRNRALLAVAWRSGLRIGEILALRPKDIDLDAGTLVVQHGKGDRRRVVGVDAGTGALVARWLQMRGRRKIKTSAPIFCTLDGGKIDQSYVRHLLLGLHVGPASRSGCTHMDFAMRTPSNSSAKERLSARSATYSVTAPRTLRTGICVVSGRERLSSSPGRGVGKVSDPIRTAGTAHSPLLDRETYWRALSSYLLVVHRGHYPCPRRFCAGQAPDS